MENKIKYLEIYTLGEGVTAIGSGFSFFTNNSTNEELKLPTIDISITNRKFKPGEDLIGKDVKEYNSIKIAFLNLEGLEVLQKAIDFCRESLIKEKK